MKFSLSSLLLLVLVAPVMASNVTITSKYVPNGRVNKSYIGIVRADNGCTPYVWTVSSGLPAGLTKKPSESTTSLDITGVPTKVGTYSFSVSATDCKKTVSKVQYTVTIQKAMEHVVDLSWKASTSKNIIGYNVYRGPNGTTWSRINVDLVGATLYDDSTVENGSSYYYSVTAINSNGQESKKTPPVKVVVP